MPQGMARTLHFPLFLSMPVRNQSTSPWKQQMFADIQFLQQFRAKVPSCGCSIPFTGYVLYLVDQFVSFTAKLGNAIMPPGTSALATGCSLLPWFTIGGSQPETVVRPPYPRSISVFQSALLCQAVRYYVDTTKDEMGLTFSIQISQFLRVERLSNSLLPPGLV